MQKLKRANQLLAWFKAQLSHCKALAFLLLLNSIPSMALAAWDTQFHAYGLNGIVKASVFDPAGNLYIAGTFTHYNDKLANHILKWDGQTWHTLGSGTNGNVFNLVADELGNIYASGIFTQAGDVAANHVAQWDGNTWHALGNGVSHYPNELAIDSQGHLYAAGRFKMSGDEFIIHVLKWDGSDWNTLTDGVGIHPNIYVGSPHAIGGLAIDSKDNVYISGSFNYIDSKYKIYDLAMWDGSTWHAISDSPLHGTLTELLIDKDDNLYVAGTDFFKDIDFQGSQIRAHNVAKWDGSRWHALSSGVNHRVNALDMDKDGNLYVGGNFHIAGGVSAYRIAKWDGSTWHALGGGTDQNVYTISADNNGDVYVGGQFNQAGERVANYIAKWDGSDWHNVSRPVGNGISKTHVRAMIIDSNDNVYVGGEFHNVGGMVSHDLAQWDGHSWRTLDNESGSSRDIYDFGLDSHENLYVAGRFTSGDGQSNYIAKWDGHAWHSYGTQLPDPVTAISIDHNDMVYVATNRSRIYRWDRYRWYAFSYQAIRGTINALSHDSKGDLYVGGSFRSIPSITTSSYITKIELTNGGRWRALDSGVNGTVMAVSVDKDDTLYVGGYFTKAGDLEVNHIAHWDGNRWNALGEGLQQYVHAIKLDDDGNLYAAGRAYINGEHIYRLSKWDGQTWQTLSSKISSVIWALDLDSQGNLYMGGGFTIVDGIPSNGIARWTGANTACLVYGVNDMGLNNTQFFVIDTADNFTVSALGTEKTGADIEGLAIKTAGDLFASSGNDADKNYPKGHLYSVNTTDGSMTAIGATGFDEVSAIAFNKAGELWGWADKQGLIQIDTTTGQGTLVLASTFGIEDIAWNTDSSVLYGIAGTTLYAYTPATGQVTEQCTNFPSEVEAIDMLADGSLVFALHADDDTNIYAYDIATCRIDASAPIATDYNDIEGIASACN